MTRITKRSVDALKAGAELTRSGGAKDSYLWDRGEGALAGFGCKCTPAGKKVFLFQYRNPTGRTRRITIGAFSDGLTPEQARTHAKALYGALKSGTDPAEARDRRKAALTFEQVRDRFIAEHVAVKLKEKSQLEYRRALKGAIHGPLANRSIEDIRRADISKLHHDMRETPFAANRMLATLSKLFSWAERLELRPQGTNPCRYVERYTEKPRERFLSSAELQSLGRALVETKESPSVVTAVRLLLFTGARLSEILSLQWGWIDFKRGVARLPDSKTGAKTLQLPAPALELLNGLERLEGSPYVLPASRGNGHYIGIQKPWRAIRKEAGLGDVRLHDLRHSFASVAAAGGASLQIIGALLGHSQIHTTQRYSHLAASPLAEASTAIAKRIEDDLNAGANPKNADNVVEMKKK